MIAGGRTEQKRYDGTRQYSQIHTLLDTKEPEQKTYQCLHSKYPPAFGAQAFQDIKAYHSKKQESVKNQSHLVLILSKQMFYLTEILFSSLIWYLPHSSRLRNLQSTGPTNLNQTSCLCEINNICLCRLDLQNYFVLF